MMGLGRLFTRDLEYEVTDTDTGASSTFTIVTDVGMYPDWSYGQYDGGMGVPAAWRAALLISDLIGALPWHAYEDTETGSARRVTPNPLVLAQPAPPDSSMTTFSSWVLDLVWHGNAIGQIVARDLNGHPLAVLPIPADEVDVKRVDRTDSMPYPLGTIVYQIGDQWVPHWDVFHVKGPCKPGALRGMGVLENHLITLNLSHDQTENAASSLAGVPTGVLKAQNPDMDQDEADALKTAWMTSQRTRTVAVLNPSVEFEALAWNPAETQLLDARRFSIHEIALIFGLDPSWLGAAQSSRVYSNLEQEGINLLRFSSIAGHLARLEAALSALLPDGQRAMANLDGPLRADTKTRYEAHEIALRNKFLSVDEVRELENRPPLPPEVAETPEENPDDTP